MERSVARARPARARLAPALLAATLSVACMHPAPPPNPSPTVVHEGERFRVTAVQTGWVAVKRRFREYAGPAFLRLPAIVLDRRWTEWLPIRFFLVEGVGGGAADALVFDTGETARTADPDWFGCDPATRWFYTRQLRFAVAPEEELGPQLEALGVPADAVGAAVLSHLHSDHVGGLSWLGGATWYLSARDANGHAGALTCRIPAHADTVLVMPPETPFGAFGRSLPLDAAGHARIVPTPGHSPGHQSLLLRDVDRWVLLAGDVAFDARRLETGRGLAGIVEDVGAARRSLRAVADQLERFDTLLVTAHDGGEDAGSGPSHRH